MTLDLARIGAILETLAGDTDATEVYAEAVVDARTFEQARQELDEEPRSYPRGRCLIFDLGDGSRFALYTRDGE